MRSNRKRVVTAVVFAVTLVLGASALVLAWRLQQEKQITEEETEASDVGVTYWCLGKETHCGNCMDSYCGWNNGSSSCSLNDYPGLNFCYGWPDLNPTYEPIGAANPCVVGANASQSFPKKPGLGAPKQFVTHVTPKNTQPWCTQHIGIEGSDGVLSKTVQDGRYWCTTSQWDHGISGKRNEFIVMHIGDGGDTCWAGWKEDGWKHGCNALSKAGFYFESDGGETRNGTYFCCNNNPSHRCGNTDITDVCPSGAGTNRGNLDQAIDALDWDCSVPVVPEPRCNSLTVAPLSVFRRSQQIDLSVVGEDPDGGPSWMNVCVSINDYNISAKPENQGTDGWKCYGASDGTYSVSGNIGTLNVTKTYQTMVNDILALPFASREGLTEEIIDAKGMFFVTNITKNDTMCSTNRAYYDPNNPEGSGIKIINNVQSGRCDGDACVGSVTLAASFGPLPEAICTGKRVNVEGAIDPGQEVTFTINYENSGSVEGTILVTDTLPNGFEAVATSTSGCNRETNRDLNGDGEINPNTVYCTIPNVAAGATGTVTITAKAKSTVRDLNTNNTATVRLDINGDGIPDDTAPDAAEIAVCSTESSTSTPGAQCVSKEDKVETFVNPGDVITYTIGYKALRTPATIHITDEMPQYTTLVLGATGSCALPAACAASTSTKLDCTFNIADALPTYENVLAFCAKVDETGIPLDGVTIRNTKVKVWEGSVEPTQYDTTCVEETEVKHKAPACDFTTPSVMTIRVADLAGTSVSLTTTGILGTHADLDFRWTATGGTLEETGWHASDGTPANGRVTDTVTWAPPTDAEDTDTFDIKVYVRPSGSTDATGLSSDDCESTTTITALDLVCLWMVPNNSFDYFPFDMTFRADIGGDQGALFTYDLDFGDGSTHYTGNGTVAAGTTVELPYVPPQDQPHRYNNLEATTYNPVLTVTNTETGETSICPTVLPGRTQSEWSIVKDSDVDTCVAENSTVTYSIVVTNTGDYTSDLAQVRDTVDSKIDTTTIANIRECDSNGQNCTTYNRTDVLSGRTITWPGRTYIAGESRKYMYTVQVNTAGDYYNVAEAIPETGATVRDDEVFPTCDAKTPVTPVAPKTGSLSTTAYIAILGMLTVAAGYYAYNTKAGAQIVANVMGKTGRSVRRSLNRKETFERDAIRSEKDKLKG